VYEGKRIDFTIEVPLCTSQLMGNTMAPFRIKAAITPRGATDGKGVEHTMLNIIVPVPNLVTQAIVLDSENYPRLGESRDCILFALRGTFDVFSVPVTPSLITNLTSVTFVFFQMTKART
jgi:hypothetical protein